MMATEESKYRNLLEHVLRTDSQYAQHMQDCVLCQNSRVAECGQGSDLLMQSILAVLNAQVHLDDAS